MHKVAIISAMEREIWPVVRNWQHLDREYDGRSFRFFENARAVVVCGGIGAEAARRACEAVISLYQPELVVSVGFAGSLDPAVKVGDCLAPRHVIDAGEGSCLETGIGGGVLVSFDSVATISQKRKLARAYAASAVDMEAAAVARAAEARGARFVAFKGISDAHDFEFPALETFIGSDGQFRTRKFIFAVLLRPWLWTKALALARNSALATKTICDWLEQYNHPAENFGALPEGGLYPSRANRH
jgi:adenosylhomocysteine nucleosidase